jgi:hypothetical protein
MSFVSSAARLFVIGKLSRISAMKMLTQQAANVGNEAALADQQVRRSIQPFFTSGPRHHSAVKAVIRARCQVGHQAILI